MGKIDKFMSFIWLLNAQVNSLCEPMLLTQKAVQQAKDYENTLRQLDKEEAGIIKKELESSLFYIKETSKKLNELEDKIFAMLENLTEMIKAAAD
ncbi:MAG: hypothetical protein PWQ97_378 [Tepidanaerobacteraceae bacterium]|nr:hypothetical protein [Tepidanaerobacteraceae bacterium]